MCYTRWTVLLIKSLVRRQRKLYCNNGYRRIHQENQQKEKYLSLPEDPQKLNVGFTRY